MEWRCQKWALTGYVIGLVVPLWFHGIRGVLVGAAIASASAALGG